MKTILTKSNLLFLLLFHLGISTMAQEKKEEIKVQITKEVDGEVKTYERSYQSEDEMNADTELKDFMGEGSDLPFWLSEKGGVYADDSLERRRRYVWSFDDDKRFFRQLEVLHPSDSFLKGMESQMKQLRVELGDIDFRIAQSLKEIEDGDVFALRMGEAFDFDIHFPDSLRERLRDQRRFHRHPDEHINVVGLKRVKITEDVDEFGKMATVKNNHRLELDEFEYFPNPSTNGRFTLALRASEEGDLSIKVLNLEGKEIFNRFIERFSGRISEIIDLSSQQEGVYLLEIQLKDKRLTRKIAID